MTLWDWAKLTWDRPGVGAACVSLQDEFRQCVPLLLWALWGIENGGFDCAIAEHAVSLCRSMEEAVITPLRTARRNAPLADRERLLANELKAEHELLDLLEAFSAPACEGNTAEGGVGGLRPLGAGLDKSPLPLADASRFPLGRGQRDIKTQLAAVSKLWGSPLPPSAFDTLLDALKAHEVADV